MAVVRRRTTPLTGQMGLNAYRMAGPQPQTYVNQQAGNVRAGQSYQVIPAAGGSYHLYPDGRKVFVRAGSPTPAAAPPAPNAPGVQPAATAAQGPAQYSLDSQYGTESATALANMQGQLADIDEQGTTDRANYEEALRRMQADRPKTELAARQEANKQGLFYSGALDTRLGDIATNYARQEGDLGYGFQQREDARTAARHALEAGYSTDDVARMLAAGDRQIGRDTTAADADSLVPDVDTTQSTTPSSAAPAARPPAAARPYRTVTAHGNVYHVYRSGRKVAVRRATRR